MIPVEIQVWCSGESTVRATNQFSTNLSSWKLLRLLFFSRLYCLSRDQRINLNIHFKNSLCLTKIIECHAIHILIAYTFAKSVQKVLRVPL